MIIYPKEPTIIDFSITSACNLACPFCSVEAEKEFEKSNHICNEQELTLEEIDNIFSQFDKMGVLRVAITGGEPFMRKDCLDILKLANNYSFSHILNTNGTLIDEIIDTMIKRYDVKITTLYDNVTNFLKEMNKNGFINQEKFNRLLKGEK